MFSSTVLDVAVALVFSFFVISLAASAILEAIAGMINWRSQMLLKGVQDLLNDKNLRGQAGQLYNNVLVNPRNDGKTDVKSKNPAYIDPLQFGRALIDVLNHGTSIVSERAAAAADPAAAGHPGPMTSRNPESVKGVIEYMIPSERDPQLHRLMGIAERAGHDIDRMRIELATWFDNAMDRLSGYYKRWTQLWLFLIALVLAGLLNVSAIHLGRAIWAQPVIVKSIEQTITNKKTDEYNANEAVAELEKRGLPIG